MKTISIFSILLLIQSFSSFSQNNWVLSKEKGNIIIWTREEKGSEYDAFKARMILHVSIDEIIKVLRDIKAYPEWFAYTEKTILIKQSDNVIYFYMETDFPWPYKNQDMVYKMIFNKISDKEVKADLIGLPSYVSEIKGVHRMQKAGGYIHLKEVGGETRISYVFHSEPSEEVPVWLANQSVTELPYKTFSALRKKLNKN